MKTKYDFALKTVSRALNQLVCLLVVLLCDQIVFTHSVMGKRNDLNGFPPNSCF